MVETESGINARTARGLNITPLPPGYPPQGWHFCRQKVFFFQLPVLTHLNRQQEAENGRSDNDPLRIGKLTAFWSRFAQALYSP